MQDKTRKKNGTDADEFANAEPRAVIRAYLLQMPVQKTGERGALLLREE